MPTLTLLEYLLALFLTQHADHTRSKRAGTDGFVYVECSCGLTLQLPSQLADRT